MSQEETLHDVAAYNWTIVFTQHIAIAWTVVNRLMCKLVKYTLTINLMCSFFISKI